MKAIGKCYSCILVIFLLYSCSTSGPGIFSKQSLHEQYGKKITDAGLKETALGKQWFAAAEQALTNPAPIKVPYKEVGYFSADQPRAVGLQFSGKRGQKLLFQLEKQSATPFVLYADLWRINVSDKPTLLSSIDTAQRSFDLEVEDNTAYILRLQPELLSSGDYTLSIAVGPSLGFPVADNAARVGSIWGDARDAGARQHQGIDIFAPKRTPAIAAADGIVTAANENNLGGKVVWLRPKGKDYTLYYAHLDEQLAQGGQKVQKGDTIGLIGNTGNARTTPPHLHFGIYTYSGAIDPYPFVNPAVQKPADVTISNDILKEKLRLTTNSTLSSASYSNSYKAYTLLQPIAASASIYRVQLPDGSLVDIPQRSVQNVQNSIRHAKLKEQQYLLDNPTTDAARKQLLAPTTPVAVMAYFNDYAFVRVKEEEGWVPVDALQ